MSRRQLRALINEYTTIAARLAAGANNLTVEDRAWCYSVAVYQGIHFC